MPAAEFSIAFSEKTKPKRNKDIPLPFLTSEERTCAASRNQILAWFSSSICCFCPSVVHWARCPALKETKVAEAQLCFHPQPLTARTSCQDPATAEMRCWRSVTLTPISSFYWFLGSDWVNSHFLHQGSSAMAIPHFASWEFSLSVSRILMTWMSTFCSLTEVVKEPPGKKHSREKNPPAQREMFYFKRSPSMLCLCSSQEHHCSARALPDLQTVKAHDWTQQAQQGNWHLPARRTWRLWQQQKAAHQVPEKSPDPAVAEIRQDTAPIRLEQHSTNTTFVRRGKEALISEPSKLSRTVQLGKKHWEY